jgi:hypothetical protein
MQLGSITQEQRNTLNSGKPITLPYLHNASKTLDTLDGHCGLLILNEWFTMYADDGFGNYIIVDFTQSFHSIN